MSIQSPQHMNPRQEQDREPAVGGVSPFAVYKDPRYFGALIWFCELAYILRQKAFTRQRSMVEFAAVDAYASVDIALVFLLILLLLFSRRMLKVMPPSMKGAVGIYAVYLVFCALSAIWSPRPAYSFYRAVEHAVFCFSIFYALSYAPDFETAEKRVLQLSLVAMLFQMTQVITLFGSFPLDLWKWHTNSYTASGAVVFCYCLGEFFAARGKRKRRMLRYGLAGFLVLSLGTSSASNVSTVAGIVAILLLGRKVGAATLLLMCFSIVFLAFDGAQIMKEILFPFKDESDIESLGGRTRIWDHYLENFLASPLIGNGFCVSSSSAFSGSSKTAFAALSHNSVLSALLGTGILGCFIMCLFLLALGLELLAEIRYSAPGAIGMAGCMVAGVVNSLAMPQIADRWVTSSFTFFIFLALFIQFVRIPNRMERAKNRAEKLRRLRSRWEHASESEESSLSR